VRLREPSSAGNSELEAHSCDDNEDSHPYLVRISKD
jgi:hypothetical protein